MNNFHKYSWKHIQKLGEKYDLGSIMHYNHHAFSVNRGQPTIIPKDPKDGTRMGQRKEFSEVDIRKINKLYKCSVSSSEADVRSTSRVKRLTINKLSE